MGRLAAGAELILAAYSRSPVDSSGLDGRPHSVRGRVSGRSLCVALLRPAAQDQQRGGVERDHRSGGELAERERVALRA